MEKDRKKRNIKNRRLRICIFSRSFFPAVGGQERVAAMLAREFSNSGHSVVVLTDTPATDGEGLPFEIYRTRRFWGRWAIFRGADRILFMSSSLQGMVGAFLACKRCYVSHQSVYGIGSGTERLAGMLKNVLSSLTINVCISDFQRRLLRAPAVIIPNPVGREFLNVKQDISRRFAFCFVGRLVSDKGVALLIDALSLVQKNFPGVSLRVIGDGPERADLEKQALRLGLCDRVEFAGVLAGPDLALAMSECECLVVPSVWEEPFGMVALEGIATCREVIVTNRGALPEVVGDFGLIVEPTINSLASAMTEYLSRANLTQDNNPERLMYLRQFYPENIAQRYLRVLCG